MQDLLKQVSRSFYLTLRVLPRSVKNQLSLAYLLARATDTVADTPLVAVERKREAVLQLRNGIAAACQGRMPALPDFGEFGAAHPSVVGQGTRAERALLESVETLLGALREFSEEDRKAISRVLDTITRGQEKDLIRFGSASKDRILALRTDDELDGYAYDVAGCVGEFWTRLCRAHLFPKAELDDTILISNAIRFGKGLQLVNILRDLPADLRQGRCYIPEEPLAGCRLEPRDLLSAGSMDRFRPLYRDYLQRAEDHLRAGWHYTAMLPRRCVRVRLACAWPILIGVRTIRRLHNANVLDEHHRVKLSRREIRNLIVRSVFRYPNREAWNRLFEQ